MPNGEFIAPSMRYYDIPMRKWNRTWSESNRHSSLRQWLKKIGVEPFCYKTAEKEYANAIIFKDKRTKYKVFIYAERTQVGVNYILAVAPLNGKIQKLSFKEIVRVIYKREFNKPTRIFTSAWYNMLAKVEELLK